jgi:hypothetical protein
MRLLARIKGERARARKLLSSTQLRHLLRQSSKLLEKRKEKGGNPKKGELLDSILYMG